MQPKQLKQPHYNNQGSLQKPALHQGNLSGVSSKQSIGMRGGGSGSIGAETSSLGPSTNINTTGSGGGGINQQIFNAQHQQMQIQSIASQSKVKKVLAYTLNQNLSTQVNNNHHQINHQQYQQSQGPSNKQDPSPTQKKLVPHVTATRYDSLQNKMKNNRRQTAGNSQILGSTSHLVGSSTSQLYSKNSQQLQDAKMQGGKIHTQLSGISLGTQRKQLKLSVDGSESSFNNISIKSNDRQNSVIRGFPQTAKHTNSQIGKDGFALLTPSSSNNIGGAHSNASQSSFYQSNFSANSRFTNTRPKNPEQNCSSLSSKNSDSQSSLCKMIPILDLKKIQLNKFAKQSASQTIRDQQQHQLHQLQEDINEANDSSQSQTHNNSKSNMNATSSHHQKLNALIDSPGYSASANSAAFKSKFTLVNKPIEIQGVQSTKDRNKKSFQFQTQTISIGSGTGGDLHRKNSLITQNLQATKSQTGINGALFSPKSTGTFNGTQKQVSKQIQQTGSDSHRLSTSGTNGPNHTNHKVNILTTQKNTLSLMANAQKQLSHNQLTTTQKQQQLDMNSASKSPQTDDELVVKNFLLSKPPSGNSNHSKYLNQVKYPVSQQQQQQQQHQLQQQQQLQQSPQIKEAIMEEQQEESAQNTKRDSIHSTSHNDVIKKSTARQHHEQVTQSSDRVSTININNNQIQKQIANVDPIQTKLLKIKQQQELDQAKQQQKHEHIDITNQKLEQQHNNTAAQIQSDEEAQQKAANLAALKAQLKAQITKQHVYSNPNQPSSQIEVDVQYPITAAKALKLYENSLTEYEKNEILDFNEIYFLGLNSPKIKGSPLLPHNYGYDDERGDYQVALKDHLAYRYEVLEFVGKGSFGQALKCYDYKTNSYVAIKIIRNKKRFHHQAGVELKILMYLNKHDPDDVNNIIRIKDYAIFRKHLIISFELLSVNLYEFIKNNNFQGVSIGLIRRFAIQILQALKYQKDLGIVHCDLKPENILLKQANKSGIKIIDYGSSCFQNQRIYTYIQSRFYRAPEIILGVPYTTAIDMWSFGCILAELYTGFPLFPGENEVEQLAYIMEIKGVPADYILDMSSRRKLFFEPQGDPIIVANSKGKKRRPLTKTLKGVLRCSDQNFLNFVEECLDWDPINRMSPLEALQHDWITEGLPPKVLLHHQRMFGQKDDKTYIREATLQQIQGFPQDTESTSIFNKVNNIKNIEDSQTNNTKSLVTEHKLVVVQDPQEHKQQQQQLVQQSQPQLQSMKETIKATFQAAANQEIQIQNEQATATVNEQIRSNNNGSSSRQMANNASSSSSNMGQRKNNKTIQLFMSELFEQKPSSSIGNNEENPNKTQLASDQAQIEPSNFYQNKPISNPKDQVNSLKLMPQVSKEVVMNSKGNIHQQSLEDDVEENVTFNHTQKIPVSLINKQEKVNTFFKPKSGGPQLNNYMSQISHTQQNQSAATRLIAHKKKAAAHGSFHKANTSAGMEMLSQRAQNGTSKYTNNYNSKGQANNSLNKINSSSGVHYDSNISGVSSGGLGVKMSATQKLAGIAAYSSQVKSGDGTHGSQTLRINPIQQRQQQSK